MKKMIFKLCITVLLGYSSIAQKSEVFIHSGKAIRGFDPVAYFTEGKPVKGDPKLVFFITKKPGPVQSQPGKICSPIWWLLRIWLI